MRKVLTVVGARPQFIKATMLSQAFRASGRFDEVIVHTGQHHDPGMSDVFFDELGIPAPRHALGIAGGSHGDMTGRMLCALEPVVQAEAPELLLVYGDTNSTLAGALVASKLHVPVVHVEAGLRSFNRRMPEEINRVVTDHLSTLLLCPTVTAVANLATEGLAKGVHLVGDIMFDAALHYGRLALESRGRSDLHEHLPSGGYVLATIHRQENTDEPARLARIVEALATLAAERPVVLPLHPRTRARLAAAGLADRLVRAGLHSTEPLGYLDMLALEQRAALVVTDSGGVQKEAYFFRVPCLTLRDETEWTELVDLGWNRLIDVVRDDLVEAARRAIGGRGREGEAPYGQGDTAQRILAAL
jgi:UDP-GlcNAc3NAcA epimerase